MPRITPAGRLAVPASRDAFPGSARED